MITPPLVSEEQMYLVTSILGSRLLVQGMTSEEADYVIFNTQEVERLLQKSATEFLSALRREMNKVKDNEVVHSVRNIDRRRSLRAAFADLRSQHKVHLNVSMGLLNSLSHQGPEEVKLVYRRIPQCMEGKELQKLAEGLRPDILAQITDYEQNNDTFETMNGLSLWDLEGSTFSFMAFHVLDGKPNLLCRRQATTFDGRFWICGVPMQYIHPAAR